MHKSFQYVKDISQTSNLTVVRLSKSVTFESLSAIQKEYTEVTKTKKTQNILFDMNEVSQTDSAGIAGLVDLLRHMKSHHINGKVGLLNLSENMRALLTISKVDGIFKDYKSEKEAIDELG